METNGFESQHIIKKDYHDGRPKREIIFVDGQKHGVAREWHLNGKLSHESPYEKGRQHGDEKWYDENGNLTLTRTWDHGALN